jgi:hypothetical protein
MRSTLIAAAGALMLVSGAPVLAKGCIRGAAAGGVAGHFVGRGHALAGAAVGCVVAHHHYAKQARAQREAARATHR